MCVKEVSSLMGVSHPVPFFGKMCPTLLLTAGGFFRLDRDLGNCPANNLLNCRGRLLVSVSCTGSGLCVTGRGRG